MIMKNWIVVWSLLLGTVCRCLAVDAFANPVTNPELIQLREGLINSFKANDMDRFGAYLATNVVVTWQSGEVCKGRESLKETFKKLTQGDRPVIQKVSLEPVVIGHQSQGDWIMAWGEMNDSFSFGGGSILPLRSRFTMTAHRSNGHWLVSSLHISANVFENPMLTSATRRVVAFGGVLAGLLGLGVGFSFGRSWKTRKTQ